MIGLRFGKGLGLTQIGRNMDRKGFFLCGKVMIDIVLSMLVWKVGEE